MPVLNQLVNTVSFALVRPLQNMRIRNQVYLLHTFVPELSKSNNSRAVLFTGCLFDVLIELSREIYQFTQPRIERRIISG